MQAIAERCVNAKLVVVVIVLLLTMHCCSTVCYYVTVDCPPHPHSHVGSQCCMSLISPSLVNTVGL